MKHTTLLTPHFTLGEFTRSAYAINHQLDNTPPAEAVANLRALCEHVLEPLRRRFGAIRITSGYRSPAVNSGVGGKPHSQHLRGEAADLFVPSREIGLKMYEFIANTLPYDQLLFEHNRKTGTRWLHVSYRSGDHANRRQCNPHYLAAASRLPGLATWRNIGRTIGL